MTIEGSGLLKKIASETTSTVCLEVSGRFYTDPRSKNRRVRLADHRGELGYRGAPTGNLARIVARYFKEEPGHKCCFCACKLFWEYRVCKGIRCPESYTRNNRAKKRDGGMKPKDKKCESRDTVCTSCSRHLVTCSPRSVMEGKWESFSVTRFRFNRRPRNFCFRGSNSRQ